MSAEFMLTAFVLFLAGVIMVPIASRLGLGSVLGYLLAGICLSPLLNYLGTDVVGIQHFAEFGVVMMLFLVGLEMTPKSLWEMRARIFVLGGLQVLVTTVVVCGIALGFGLSWTTGLAIGMVLALSSTAIVNQTLNEKGLLKSDGGQASFSVLLFQDIAVIPMLIIIPLLAVNAGVSGVESHAGDAAHGGGLNLNLVEGLPNWQAAGITMLTVAAVVLAGKYLTNPIFRFISKARLRELFVSTALMLVLGISLLMTLVGLSPALGTFLAGVVMAGSEFRHELESDIAPFKGIFLGVFFITVGAAIDFSLLREHLALVLGLTALLIAIKALVLLVLARVFKLRGGDKWLFALGLAQAGEFGFVLLSFAVSNHALPEKTADILLLLVALSMILTPALFILYDRVIAPRYSKVQQREADTIDHHSGIIIAGHGRFGGLINRALRNANIDTTVVDYSAEQLQILRSFDFNVYYGDATRPDLLHSAGIDSAKVLLIAIDDKEAITGMCRYVVKHHPHVHVIARAIDRHHVYELWSAGCRDIIRETYDSALRASRSLFEALGHSREKATALVSEFEHFDRSSMQELAELYDINVPVMENEAYVKRAKEIAKEQEARLHAQSNKAPSQ